MHPIRGTRVRQHFVLAVAFEGSSPRTSVDYPYADNTPLHMDNLIPKDALLDAIEDDDDNHWNTDPFKFPDRVGRESPEELVAMIQLVPCT